MEILAVKNLSFTYPGCKTKALDGVSFSVERGDFVAVCGETGSGKSTLMRLLKTSLAPLGETSGGIFYKGNPISNVSDAENASAIGYVMQRPEEQAVTDKVWHEMAFGLENLNVKTDEIRRRVSEIACYFGIEEWFDKSISELSGGQKQLLNLAAVTVMQPEILLLDEPTAQLDPIAASDFISTLQKLVRDLSLTVIIIEHRLEEVIPASNKLLALRGGKVLAFGETRATVEALIHDEKALCGMPSAVRLFAKVGVKSRCPLTVREGRNFIENNFGNDIKSLAKNETSTTKPAALEFKDVFFRYGRELPDVLRGLTLTVHENELFFILGGNGSGKSTCLAAASALIKPYSGKIKVFGKNINEYKSQTLYRGCLSLLPQDVQTVFLYATVREELADADLSDFPFDLSPLLDTHPYDLSGGQAQLAALAKLLSSKPRLLLLDEPTKGLDAYTKEKLISVLRKLKADGMTVVCVTHDVEFAAECADRCAMLFRGEVTSIDARRSFFDGNSFYTTAANRMARGRYTSVSTVDELARLCIANKAGVKQ